MRGTGIERAALRGPATVAGVDRLLLTEPLAVLGAMLTGRPVRFVLDREEEMLYGSPRGAERIYISGPMSGLPDPVRDKPRRSGREG